MSTVRGLGGVACVVAVVLGCTVHRRLLPPPPVCAEGTVAGLDSRSVRWNPSGWGALSFDGRSLYLGEYSLSTEPRGPPVNLGADASGADLADLAWSHGAWWVAYVTRDRAHCRFMRVERGEARVVESSVTAVRELSVISTGDTDNPAAVFIDAQPGVTLKIWTADGDLGASRQCPAGVRVRTVSAWPDEGDGTDGFAALQTSGPSLTFVRLDNHCRRERSVSLTNEIDFAKPFSLMVDRDGAVVVWSDPAGRAHVAAVDRDTERARLATIDGAVEPQRVLSLRGRDGARRSLRMLALRESDGQRQLLLYQLDAGLHVVDIGGVTSEPIEALRFVAAEPWGGALVGWARDPQARGVRSITGGEYVFMSRVCR